MAGGSEARPYPRGPGCLTAADYNRRGRRRLPGAVRCRPLVLLVRVGLSVAQRRKPKVALASVVDAHMDSTFLLAISVLACISQLTSHIRRGPRISKTALSEVLSPLRSILGKSRRTVDLLRNYIYHVKSNRV